jgi:hypothetical protein
MVREQAGRLLAARRTVEIMNESLIVARRMRELLDQRVTEGETPKLDANIATVEVGRMEADLVLAQAEADGEAIELKALVGLPPDAPMVLRDTLESLVRVPPEPATPALPMEAALAARPDVLWVGMTAPKQELWVARNRHRLEVPLVGSVGAAFDYLAGTKTRSPLWFREHGLEWLPRLVMEPARLWRRTFLSAPMFLWYSLCESLSRRTGARS